MLPLLLALSLSKCASTADCSVSLPESEFPSGSESSITITVCSFEGEFDAVLDFRDGDTEVEVDGAVVEPGAHRL